MSISKKLKMVLKASAAIVIGFFVFNKSEGFVRDAGLIRKLSKEEVGYREPYFVPLTNLYYKCSDCVSYVRNDSTCKLIEGNVSENGGCNRWAGIKAYTSLNSKVEDDTPEFDDDLISRHVY